MSSRTVGPSGASPMYELNSSVTGSPIRLTGQTFSFDALSNFPSVFRTEPRICHYCTIIPERCDGLNPTETQTVYNIVSYQPRTRQLKVIADTVSRLTGCKARLQISSNDSGWGVMLKSKVKLSILEDSATYLGSYFGSAGTNFKYNKTYYLANQVILSVAKRLRKGIFSGKPITKLSLDVELAQRYNQLIVWKHFVQQLQEVLTVKHFETAHTHFSRIPAKESRSIKKQTRMKFHSLTRMVGILDPIEVEATFSDLNPRFSPFFPTDDLLQSPDPLVSNSALRISQLNTDLHTWYTGPLTVVCRMQSKLLSALSNKNTMHPDGISFLKRMDRWLKVIVPKPILTILRERSGTKRSVQDDIRERDKIDGITRKNSTALREVTSRTVKVAMTKIRKKAYFVCPFAFVSLVTSSKGGDISNLMTSLRSTGYYEVYNQEYITIDSSPIFRVLKDLDILPRMLRVYGRTRTKVTDVFMPSRARYEYNPKYPKGYRFADANVSKCLRTRVSKSQPKKIHKTPPAQTIKRIGQSYKKDLRFGGRVEFEKRGDRSDSPKYNVNVDVNQQANRQTDPYLLYGFIQTKRDDVRVRRQETNTGSPWVIPRAKKKRNREVQRQTRRGTLYEVKNRRGDYTPRTKKAIDALPPKEKRELLKKKRANFVPPILPMRSSDQKGSDHATSRLTKLEQLQEKLKKKGIAKRAINSNRKKQRERSRRNRKG